MANNPSIHNVALFGTSADPPTIAHGMILKYLATRFDHVAVWAADNPFKPEQTPLDRRHQMLKLLIEELGCEDLRSPERERLVLHPELSFPRTWNTLEAAKTLWSEARFTPIFTPIFTLVVGADILPQLPHWYRATELLQQVKVLLIPRQGYEIKQADLDRLKALTIQVEIAPFVPPQISSSEYRKQGDAAHLLTPRMQAYLDRTPLYQSSHAVMQQSQQKSFHRFSNGRQIFR
jgi:nicotinate-nucleotide adenylyltransferase